MKKRKIVLGIGGSSGSIYAKLLLERFMQFANIEVGVVMTKNAKTNWQIEIGKFDSSLYPFTFYENNDFFAPFASGSSLYKSMIICPCSMGLIGRISSGISNDLISRAADVILKERRKLILVPREAPYNLFQLRNMTNITEAGGIVCPASPSFYSNPTTINDLLNTLIDRIIDIIDLPQENVYRWQE